jgi:hypothetical protein
MIIFVRGDHLWERPKDGPMAIYGELAIYG